MASSQHKALILRSQGGPLTLGTIPTPQPGKGELLVKIHAAGMNPADVYQATMGVYVDSYPFVCGMDGAGVVEAVGEGVTDFMKGDRVAYGADFSSRMHTFQEYAIAKADFTGKIPDNASFEEASTIPLCLVTATIGLYGEPKKAHGGAGFLPPWEEGGKGKYHNVPIFVAGGSTSVGIFAIQMAKMSGFNPIIATASSHNEDYCKAAGATHVIDYKQTPYGPKLAEVVASITSTPVKVVWDCVFTPECQIACYGMLAPKGKYICAHWAPSQEIGGDGFEDKDGRKVIGVLGSVYDDASGGDSRLGKSLFTSLQKMMADGDVKACKIELLPGGLSGVAEGVQRLKAGQVSGRKLVAKLVDTPGF